MLHEHGSPAGGRDGDRALVAFVREVKAALLDAAAEAAQRGLAITAARLQMTSTLSSGPAGSIGASGGVGALFLDVAQLSFHRQRSDSHQLDISFEPPPPAPAPATAGQPNLPGGVGARGPGGTGAGAAGPDAGDAGTGAAAPGGSAGKMASGAAPRADAGRLGMAAGAQRDTGVIPRLFRTRSPDRGPLAQQLAAVVGSVAEVAGVLFAEKPACRPAGGAAGGPDGGAAGGADGGAAGGADGGAAGGAAASAAGGRSGGAAPSAAGTPTAPRGDVPSRAGAPQVPLATMTLNLGVDEGGTVELIFGGRRDVQTTHSLTLTFGPLRG